MRYYTNELPKNRSVPPSMVVPVLPYPDVRQAVAWLTKVFGFTERLQIADHRSQMRIGIAGDMIVAEYIDREHRPQVGAAYTTHQIMVRIPDLTTHFEHVQKCGAEILEEPVEHIYGEIQYVVRDLGGHRWIFSQTTSDANPNEWGSEGVILKEGS